MSRRFVVRLSVLPAVLTAAAVAFNAAADAAHAAEPAVPTAGPGWRIVATVGTSTQGELPGHLAATGPDDAFASWQCATCSRSTRNENFVQRWNGHDWSRIALPVALNYPRSVIALGASAATNLWAFTNNGRAGIWNGHSWAIRTLPAWVLRPTRVGEPAAQTAVFSPGNVWVFSVGAISEPALAARFHRGAWRKVSLPCAPVQVSAVGPDDIWVVGITKQSLTTTKPVWAAMHWNGSSWHTLALPKVSIPAGNSAGYGIVGTGPRDLWVTREIGSFNHTASAALLHWTGAWHVIKAPSSLDAFEVLARDGRGGLWMVAQSGFSPAMSFLYHHGSAGWFRQAIPAKAGKGAFVAAMAWIPGTRSLWAIGGYGNGSAENGEILKYGP